MPSSPSSRIVASQDVLAREIKGETVLLDLKTEHYFGLTGVGSRIWPLIVAGTSLQELQTVVAAEFAVAEDTLTRDLTRLLDDLAQAGLVTIDNADGASREGAIPS
jgi:hypothetical protein